ncbi:GNAT family N-acetyltransferase [Phycicoccus endophyticus]|uniref:GNAT family N-acetyltransferase n=1 Tax=Phycicoccus endophyticus TaxID=1690220 RepID=A0A7G9QZK8_9MICO|nr:GNAT family N-acetyltransferase [Phycicoccus endophyticus]NHI19968.1 GNAT family N-acetyltransferase [Phycicoccus endophyticus]QNN48783.1 GNAT family N-acetyltransferase [Phycicoccus endophyticus]GGL42994.1 N-acetyltransferase [Phycicoccus endophyticus]
MSDISVRALGAEDWEQYRSMRLTALRESPEAFVAKLADEESEPEAFWRARMERSTRLLAERDGEALGIASVGEVGEDHEGHAQLFGLFVRPEARGTGVAAALVRAGARVATEQGRTQLYYWVGTDNGRAVAFASSFGFRPTGTRRPMRVVSEDDGEEEIAMTLPLSGDRGGMPDF